MSAPSVITLTPAAIEFAREAIAGEDYGLRVAIVGGGCSGYNYALNLDDDLDEEDLVLQFEDVRVYLDPHSYTLLKGTVINYVTEFGKSGFSFSNPNAKKTCGCGSSFSV